jgi:hypothetical protein
VTIKKIINWIKGIFVMQEKKEHIGFYVCSLIDILGQKEKLMKLNDISLDESISIFQQTYGNVNKFREYTNDSISFVNQIKSKHNFENSFTSNLIEMKSFSDLITSYVLLGNNEHKLQFQGIYFLLLSNCEVFLKMLANGIALRGGIDLGMAMKNDENELYGSALLNPYIIESKVTKSIRIVIGQTLYNYIQETSSNEYLNDKLLDLNIRYAQLCKKLIKQDTDGEYILDYLSDEFKEMESFVICGKKAKQFLDSEYNNLRKKQEFDVAKKYQQAIKYFESKEID